jgi:hypothetical protein
MFRVDEACAKALHDSIHRGGAAASSALFKGQKVNVQDAGHWM